MKKRQVCLIAAAMAAVLVFPAFVQAQQGSISIDKVSCIWGVDTITIPTNVKFTLRYTNNTDRRVDVSNGFRIFTPDGAIIGLKNYPI